MKLRMMRWMRITRLCHNCSYFDYYVVITQLFIDGDK